MFGTKKILTVAALTLGAAYCATAPSSHQSAPRTAVLTIAQDGGLGIGYESADREDFLALVRPVGEPVITRAPVAQFVWFAKQEFEVLDSPDFQGSTVSAYYVVHAVDIPGPVGLGPAEPLPLDGGKYLMVGRKQDDGSIQFHYNTTLAGSPPISVVPAEELNVTITGLFAVTGVSWADGGPRWRFVYETIAANMANARAGALGDITFAIRRLLGGRLPKIPGEELAPSTRRDAQTARYIDIVRRVISGTEATATTEDKVYYRSILVHHKLSREVEEFIDAAHRLIVDEGGDMPESFAWPALHFTAADEKMHGLPVGYTVPKGAYQIKLLEMAESTSSDSARGTAMGNISDLEQTAEQRRYFALIGDQSPTGRVFYYEKLISWRNITGVEIRTERRRGGSIARIVNEASVRSRIAQSLGV